MRFFAGLARDDADPLSSAAGPWLSPRHDQALHRSAIPLRSIAAGEPGRYIPKPCEGGRDERA